MVCHSYTIYVIGNVYLFLIYKYNTGHSFPDSENPRMITPELESTDPSMSCTVNVMKSHGKISGMQPFSIPNKCKYPWSKVILHVETQIAGVQYDRY